MRTNLLILLLAFFLFLCSCNNKKTDAPFPIDYVPILDENNDVHKLLGAEGAITDLTVDSVGF